MTIRQKILKFFAVLITLLYPFAVFWSLERHLSMRFMVVILGIGVTAGFLKHGKKTVLLLGVLLCTALYVFNDIMFLKLYPVMMNALMCAAFWSSLYKKPLITVFAEKMHCVLDDDGLAYTRKVTVAWTAFMAANTVLSMVSVFLSDWLWTLYNGLISYILIGIMIVGEYLIRQRRKYAD